MWVGKEGGGGRGEEEEARREKEKGRKRERERERENRGSVPRNKPVCWHLEINRAFSTAYLSLSLSPLPSPPPPRAIQAPLPASLPQGGGHRDMEAASAAASSSSSSSSSSSASSASSARKRPRPRGVDANSLCRKIARRLSVEAHLELTAFDHFRGARALAKLKAALTDVPASGDEEATLAEDVTPQSVMLLTCAGVHLLKRIVHASDEVSKSLRTTCALLFATIVLATPPDEEGGEEAAMQAAAALEAFRMSSLSVSMETSTKDIDPPLSSAEVSRVCMRVARNSAEMDMDKLEELSQQFFWSTHQAMLLNLFSSTNTSKGGGDDFLTLSSASLLRSVEPSRDAKLAALADVAESEAGQSVLRDLILSFTLPTKVVGTRTTCLLTRRSNRVATLEFSGILGNAHDAAMRGAAWSFSEDENEVHRISALLAGLAVLLTRNAQSIRRDEAFRGRVSLPFLNTNVEPGYENRPRLLYVRDSNTWSCYTLNSEDTPIVHCQGSGFTGFVESCLVFLQSVDT